MNNPKKRKTAQELRKEIGFAFPKGFAESNYDYEAYQNKIIQEQDDFIEFLIGKLNKSREGLEQEFKLLS